MGPDPPKPLPWVLPMSRLRFPVRAAVELSARRSDDTYRCARDVPPTMSRFRSIWRELNASLWFVPAGWWGRRSSSGKGDGDVGGSDAEEIRTEPIDEEWSETKLTWKARLRSAAAWARRPSRGRGAARRGDHAADGSARSPVARDPVAPSRSQDGGGQHQADAPMVKVVWLRVVGANPEVRPREERLVETLDQRGRPRPSPPWGTASTSTPPRRARPP